MQFFTQPGKKTSGLKAQRHPRITVLVRSLALIVVYVATALLGKRASFFSGGAHLVWPAFGLALGWILLFGYAYWPGVAVGAAIFSVLSGHSLGFFTAGTVLGNTVGACVCAYLLERFVQFRPSLERARDVAGLIGWAGLLGTTVNAAFSAVGQVFQGAIPSEELFSATLEWWVPNMMAVLVVTPFLLAWGAATRRSWKWEQGVEAALCAAGLAGGTLISFNSWFVYGIETYPLAYLPYPFLIWGALRFGPRGAATGTLLVSALAIDALLDQRGPFVSANPRDSLMLIGSYLGILAVTNLLLAAVAAERRQAEEAMAQSERRYRAVVEDQTEMVWRFKPDGTVTFVNDAFCKFHGKDRAELIGANNFWLLPEEDREIPLSYFNCLPQENPIVSYDYKLTLADGRIVWQQCTTRRLFDEQGQTTEFQSVAQDVTRRKQTEEDLRQAEQRQRAILNSMVDGIVVTDGHGAITSMNPAAERIFSRGADAVLQRPIFELFAAETAPAEIPPAQALHEARSRMVETAALRPDGSRTPVELAVSEIKLGGAPLVICVVRDISERKRMEEQIRQSQKLEAIGRLAGGIAHDFNNIIQAVIGYANLLLKRLAPGDPNVDTAGQIEKAAERATGLTSQLLAFSRKQMLKPKVVSLNSLVADMQKLLQRLIGETVQLVSVQAKELGMILADPGQIEQVILNLGINARDAMPQGGALTLKTEDLQLNEPLDGFSTDFKPGRFAALSVQDTGCGMSPEVKARIFEPFFTTKGIGKGTGLGLSIVYGICKQSGGEVLVESRPGHGTTFRLFFPVIDAPEEKKEIAPPPPSAGGEETLLLVEDGEIVRAMLVEVLGSHGYRVLEATDGPEALRLAEQHSGAIHMLITDLVMPKMNGRQLADRLRSSRPQLRVLFISGYTDDEIVRFGAPETRSEFMQKPFRPEALLAKVRQVLDAK